MEFLGNKKYILEKFNARAYTEWIYEDKFVPVLN
jgi:hypothetical protein